MELSKNVIKFVIGVLLTILGFFVSNDVYFRNAPLFGVPFFGQVLVAFALGAFGVLVLPAAGFTVVKWFEGVVVRTVEQVSEQKALKALEAKKKLEEKKEEEEQRMSNEGAVILDTSAIIDGRVLELLS